MNIDFSKVITAQQRRDQELQQARDSALEQRRAAYAAESDPLRFEAEYDALVSGTAPDYSRWAACVAEIKQRYPIPG